MNIGSDFKLKPWMIISAVLVGIVLVGLIMASWINSVKNEGFTLQRAVITKYQGVETELSTCLDNSMVAAGVAQKERDTLKDVLIGTASARYQDGSGKAVDPANSQIAINVIVEAYPQITDELFRQLMTISTGCRNQVKGAQQDLQAYGGRFDTWTQTGPWYEKWLRNDYPDDRLKVTGTNGSQVTARDALDFIVTPISTGEAKDAVTSKNMPNQQLFPSASPSQ